MRTVLDFHRARARSDLLFTMSNNTRAAGHSLAARELFCVWTSRTAQRAPIDRRSGGARRDRTDDLLLAKQALSQLSYGPFRDQMSVIGNQKKS